MRRLVRHLVRLLVVVLIWPRIGGAQVTVLEEGTFSLVQRGVRVGREDFSIRRVQTSSGNSMIAQANIVIGDQRRTVALSVDSLGSPVRYRSEVFQSGRSAELATGEARGSLWSGRTLSVLGESAREFRLASGTLAAEDEVVHQIWFLLRFRTEETITVLAPPTFRVSPMTITPTSSDVLRIGTANIASQRWVIRSGETVVQEIWTDTRGRLLQVRFVARGIDAIRDELPD